MEWIPTDDNISQYVFSGRLKHLPKLKSNEVRIFISSTFTDMYAERNALFKSVYPRLQSYCRNRWNVDFLAVDMRWGIQSGAMNDHSASDLCMAELKTCQEQSLGPNFVLLLGQRYGTRQIPIVIPEVEYAALICELEALNTPEADMELLQKWFLCDRNASPPERKLQPLDAVGVDGKEYAESIEPRLLSLLRTAADECRKKNVITQDAHRRYFWSVTDEEVHNGILDASDVNNRCLCFVRTIENLNLKHPKAWRFIDMKASGTVDAEAQALLEAMQKNVRRTLNKDVVRDFTVQWCDDGGVNEVAHAAYLEEFCNAFYDRVAEMIDKSAEKKHSTNLVDKFPFLAEVFDHNNQALEKLKTFQGRDDILDKVKNYIESDSIHPLIVYGDSGCGKTSIMAMSSVKIFQWLGDWNPVIVVRRFIGTTPESTNFEPVLRGVVSQVMGFCGKVIEPLHIKDPLQLLDKLFEMLPKDVRLTIFLDSLDQLSPVGDAYSLKWIPHEVPGNIRLVLSILPEEHDLLMKLQSRGYPATAFLKVDMLSTETSIELLLRWHASAKRLFTTDQVECIRSTLQKSYNSPLHVKLLFDIAKHTPSYMDATAFTKQLATLLQADQCISHIFNELRKKHGNQLVNKALYFLGYSKQGLTENEMLDMLSLDDDVLNDVFQFHVPPVRRLPTVLWRRLRRDLSEYIVERDSYGSKVLWWYHRQFIATARIEISKLNSDETELVLSIMTDYFTGKWANGKPKPFTYPDHIAAKLQLPAKESEADRCVLPQPNILSNGKPNARKLINLPDILLQRPSSMSVQQFTTEVASNIQAIVGLFTIYASASVTWALFRSLASVSPYDTAEELREYLRGCRLLQKVMLQRGVICSAYPKCVAPILASQLLPYYGVSLPVDRLLEDIYTSGLIYNAMVVRSEQTDVFDRTLWFEMTNEHIKPVRSLLGLANGDFVSASTKIVLTDTKEFEVVMRYSPKLSDGDYFQFVRATKDGNVRYFVASLALQPLVYVFSVEQRECLGIVDCRQFVETNGFCITGLQAFRSGKQELFMVTESSRRELLLFEATDFERILYRYTSDSVVLAAIPYDVDKLLVLQRRQSHFLSLVTGEDKLLKVEITSEMASLFEDTFEFCCITQSNNVLVLATQDGKLYVSKKESPATYHRTILDSPAHHIAITTKAMAICTDQFVYVTSNYSSETMTMHYRIQMFADFTGFMYLENDADDSSFIVCYGLGVESVLCLVQHDGRVLAREIHSFVAHDSPITDFFHRDTVSTTCSIDGSVRVHVPLMSLMIKNQSSKQNRMDLKIDLVKGYDERAVSLSKKARQAAVWDLKSGQIIRRFMHESMYDLCDVAICSHTVITADDEGCIYFWNLTGKDDKPRCTATVRGLSDMFLNSVGDLYVLSSSTLTVINSFSSALISKRFIFDGQVAAHGWSTDGFALLAEAGELVASVLTEEVNLQKPLSAFKGIPYNSEKVIGISFVKQVLIVCFQTRAVFCDYFNECVLMSIALKKPTLLKPSAEAVAIRSGYRLHLFNLDRGVSQLGSISLSSTKDQAVLSPDGQYCLVLKAPRLLQLFRISDLKEIGMYPSNSDVACIAFTEDGKQVLAGLVDTRLLSFLVVDVQCANHRSRTEGILQKPASQDEAEKRRKAVDELWRLTDTDSDVEAEKEEELTESIDDVLSRPNLNTIYIEPGGSDELRINHKNYAVDIQRRVWRNYSLNGLPGSGQLYHVLRMFQQRQRSSGISQKPTWEDEARKRWEAIDEISQELESSSDEDDDEE